MRKLIIPTQSWDADETEKDDASSTEVINPSVTFNYARL
jgi:hypothetical protein